MIDHLGLVVRDGAVSRAFYEKALAPLGITVIMEFAPHVGFGDHGKPYFWITPGAPGTPLHIAFAAEDRATVDKFYEAAVAAGGRDNGGPGPRPVYHEHYYGAFVFDPDGNNVEAVCHRPA